MIIPITQRAAQVFVLEHHRHHGRVAGAKFCLGWEVAGELRAVLIAGRPVARGLDDGRTIEITRLASDGAPNACSALYAAAWRAAKAMGYRRALTYTLASERGTTLRAAGWTRAAEIAGRSWSCDSRPRTDKHPTVDKVRWEVAA